MATLLAIRERMRNARIAALKEHIAPLLRTHPYARVLLFGSLARGDWDAFSDVDLLAIAPTAEQANHLADALLAAGVADDVIALTDSRWDHLRCGDDPYWQAIGRDALCLASS